MTHDCILCRRSENPRACSHLLSALLVMVLVYACCTPGVQDRGWKVVNVGYKEWEALPEDASIKAAALLQLLATQLGPVSSWQRVGPPARAPGSLVADAEAAQAAAAAAQRQQLLQQQRDMMLNSWKAAASSSMSDSSSTGLFGSGAGGVFVPGMLGGLGVPVSAAGPSAGGFFGSSVEQQGSWGALGSGTNPAAGFGAWGAGQGGGLGLAMMPGALGVWGSGALTGAGGVGTPGPSILQQLTQLQQQLQQQQAWDAFIAADAAGSAAAAAAVSSKKADSVASLTVKDRAVSLDAGGACSSVADGAASVPPSPASGMVLGSASGSVVGDAAAGAAGPDVLPGAEELCAALAAAQQKWNNSPSSTQGSGSSNNRKAAAFMWGDPTAASIWAP